MLESLLCFLNEVLSWLNQELCALLFLSSFSHSPTAGIINIEIRLLWNIFPILEDVYKTWAGCKGSWNYAQVFFFGGGILWPTSKWLICCWVFGIQCVFCFIVKGAQGRVDSCKALCLQLPSPHSDWPIAPHRHAVYS